MYNQMNMFGGYNSMPTATQPYGVPMSPYISNPQTQPMPQMAQMQQVQQQQQPQVVNTNTNKIYVNGLEDARNRTLPFNSDFIFLDNDKAILYQKVVDSKGQFEVKTFDIVPHKEREIKNTNQINMEDYVLRKDFNEIQNEIDTIKSGLEKLNKTISDKQIKELEDNGNGTNRTIENSGTTRTI